MIKNLIKISLFVLTFFILQNITHSQSNSGGLPLSSLTAIESDFEIKIMPGFNSAGYLEEDIQNSSKQDVPYRYGKVFEVNFDLNNSGTWTLLPDGSRIWRLAIRSESAFSINIFYKDFFIPKGGIFFIYNNEKTSIHGAFNELNNNPSYEFSTAPTTGDQTILEYYEPVYSKGKGRLKVSQVVHAYKDIFGLLEVDELPCNININCPIGAPWVEQKRSVTRITFTQNGSGYLCSGSLVNNALQDRSLLYLTAEHCAPDNHNSMVFYFNYESSSCIGTSGSLSQSLSGATLKAANYATDFRLVEITGSIPASFNAYFNGWDRSGIQPANQTAIHHPGGANKKISLDNQPANHSNGFGNRLPNGFWQVFWDEGMTEGGSSGCPLYDQNKRVIGQNLGGTPSQCENPQVVSKVFGKFSASWNNGGSSGNQLKDWLDPNNSNIVTIDGINDQQGIAPITNFTSNNQVLPLGGGSVNFFDLTTNVPTTWSWSFPGGTPSTSTDKNPVNISYTATGFYTVTLTTSNQFGSNVKTTVNYIKVSGVTINSFTLISPPSLSTIEVSPNDTSIVRFIWNSSNPSPTMRYSIIFRKLITAVDYYFESDNGAQDTVISLRKSFLDSLCTVMGYTGDSLRCTWRVAATNGVDTVNSANTYLLTIKRSTIGINQLSTKIPEKFSLYNNYPNPFNPVTLIKFDVAKTQLIKIRIFDVQGREVAVLVNNYLAPGTYNTDFDGSNFASGMYFYTLESDGFYEVKKMVLVK